MGADEVVVSRDGRFAEDVKHVAGGEGLDVACDNVGAPVFQEALGACARGRATCWSASSQAQCCSARRLFPKGVSLLSVMSTSRTQLADVIELVRRGRSRRR